MAVAPKRDARKDSETRAAAAKVERTNAALRAGGIDYRVEPGLPFDAKAFAVAALKRWPRVMAKLAE